MKDFYIHMSDGKMFLFRASNMKIVLDKIGEAKLTKNGFLQVRIPEIFKYVTINVGEITYIEEEDDW